MKAEISFTQLVIVIAVQVPVVVPLWDTLTKLDSSQI